MSCPLKNLFPGCCRNCPQLQGTPPVVAAPPVTRSHPLPAMAVVDSLPPPAAPMVLPEPDQPADGKTAVAPSDTTPEPSVSASKPGLATFLEAHPKKGLLRIQAYRGQQVLPVPEVHVVVSRRFDQEQHIVFEGDTDQSGILDGIVLPAAPKDQSLEPGEPIPSASYDLFATHPDYRDFSTIVDIYEGIKTTQMLQMLLRPEG